MKHSKMRRYLMLIAALAALRVTAQAQQKLTLKEAEEFALENHPQIKASQFRALAAGEVKKEVRSVYYPQLIGSMTGVVADDNSRITAGGLNNPIIYNRYADGLTMSQFITDFGRTSRLSESAQLHAKALEEDTAAAKADILLQVDRLYFSALRAQAVLGVAKETVQTRQLLVDQVTALADSKLKSTLDVSFAKVNLADAQLLLIKAQNDVQATFTQLSTALGYRDRQEFQLVDEPVPPPPAPEASPLAESALKNRPELSSLRLEEESAEAFARAEKDLRLPTVSSLFAAGVTPAHASNLTDHYAAAGVNINFPIFNGHLFSARRAEAELKAKAALESVRDEENKIVRDVRLALLNANTAFQRLELTAELLNHSTQALDLAQSRYNLGLGSIIELSQAQLNHTAAQIEQSSARYDYQILHATLEYEVGQMR
jgi:outer membrane protein